MILLVADIADLKATVDQSANGVVLEAKLDRARGIVATILVQSGTLRIGDPFIAGSAFGKVRAMSDEHGRRIVTAGPSTPVEVMGFASEPTADFTWTEMQHSGIDWGDAWRMWAYASSTNCPTRRAIPGVRIAYTDEREIQHALDGGAMVLVVPTVDTVEEAREVVQWTYFPPMGRRSQGGSQTNAVLSPWLTAAGLTNQHYRQTFNNNIVLIVMIETIQGVKNAAAIAKVPGIHGVFAASGDLGNFSGYSEGDADYEKLITEVANATLGAGKRLCGPFRWNDRPGFTCFQD
jgi:2-keto-3-deoxy-L-rhamnonate aldolase RhmA